MVDLSIILPTYNEKDSIAKVITAINDEIKKHHLNAEVVVVDDNSPDGTAEIVSQLKKTISHLKLLVRTDKHGLGLSIKDGIKAAQGKIIIGMDADFNHDPAQINALFTNLKDSDLVVASRFISGGGMADKKRYFATWFYNLFLKILGFPTMDNMSGYYAISKDQLIGLGLDRIYYGYGDYHLRLVWLAKKSGLKIKEIPTFYHQRIGGKSKSNLTAMLFSYSREVINLSLGKEIKKG